MPGCRIIPDEVVHLTWKLFGAGELRPRIRAHQLHPQDRWRRGLRVRETLSRVLPAVANLSSPLDQHRLRRGEKKCVTLAVRKKPNFGISLTLLGFKEEQPAGVGCRAVRPASGGVHRGEVNDAYQERPGQA